MIGLSKRYKLIDSGGGFCECGHYHETTTTKLNGLMTIEIERSCPSPSCLACKGFKGPKVKVVDELSRAKQA